MTTVSAIAEKFSTLIKLERGDVTTPVTGLAAGHLAARSDIAFAGEPNHLAQAKNGKSQIWIVRPKLLPLVPAEISVVFTAPNVHLAMALIGRTFFPPTLNTGPFDGAPIHPSAVIHPTAEIGAGVVIGPHATIGARCKIGANCIIGANSTLEAECAIGARTHIFSQVFLGYQTQVGQDCVIKPQTAIGTEGFGFAHDQAGNHYHVVHYGRVVIGDRVRIGAGCQFDRGTFEDSMLGDGTIIDNQCHFGHNFKVGKNCIFVGGVIIAGSVTIGDNCVFGGRTTIGGHIRIVDNCQFAGLSGVPSGIDKPGKYGGYPAIPLNDALRASAMQTHLPRMRRNLARVMKHLGLSTEEGG